MSDLTIGYTPGTGYVPTSNRNQSTTSTQATDPVDRAEISEAAYCEDEWDTWMGRSGTSPHGSPPGGEPAPPAPEPIPPIEPVVPRWPDGSQDASTTRPGVQQ